MAITKIDEEDIGNISTVCLDLKTNTVTATILVGYKKRYLESKRLSWQ